MTDAHRTPREWATLAVAVVLLTVVCLLAARWQWHRYHVREEAIAVVESNYESEPVPLEEVVTGPGDELDEADVWRQVTMTGTYDPDQTVLLRNRPVGGTPGFHVLVPFEVTEGSASGTVLVVDRGFVTWGEDSMSAAAIPDPPEGTVEVTGHLREDEPASDRQAPDHQVQAISTDQVLSEGADGGDWADGRTTGAYVALVSEDPAPQTALVPVPEPDTDPGSHLSYTVQWIIFAVGAVGGFIVLVRRERGPSIVAGNLTTDGESVTVAPRDRRRRDEDDEDAEIDSALGAGSPPQARDTSSA
ncbi:SURF1 family cytochrome oxidase biogenesis protein [Paraoerskovia marina]|uniref:SURF1 family cytochrome oxidase biogenesis protein n=1 Tax=Paraoerskovia marina TaxID=545619 RepID=UPI000492A6E1|nr:SURF1 family protein [Paraoerskovia marina]